MRERLDLIRKDMGEVQVSSGNDECEVIGAFKGNMSRQWELGTEIKKKRVGRPGAVAQACNPST